MSTNKITMCYGPLDVRVEEREIEKPAPGQIQIEVKTALTCGTDVKTYKRGYPLRKPPYSLGHEFSGVVTAVGKGMEESLIGKRAVTSNGAGCQNCYYCKRSMDNLCEELETNFDEYVQMGGGFAKYINVKAPIVRQNLKILPDDMSYEQAAMLEPLSVALHGINLANILVGDTVAILGAGPIGLLMVELSKMKGAKVIMIEKNNDRLNKSGEMGADILINPSEVNDVVKEVQSVANNGRGPNQAIEAIGLTETWEQAIQMVGKGGTVVEYGGCPAGTYITADTKRLHYDEITVKGSYSTTAHETEAAYSLLKNNVINSSEYISGTYSLDNIKEALDDHMNQKGIKFAIIP